MSKGPQQETEHDGPRAGKYKFYFGGRDIRESIPIDLSVGEQEEKSFEDQKKREDHADERRLKELHLEALKKDIEAKHEMGKRVYKLVVIWLICMLLVIVMQGMDKCIFWPYYWPEKGFHLSDTVLIALITTTTANVAFFLTMVIKHLYPSGLSSEKKK